MRKLNFKVIVAITICAFAFSACNKELTNKTDINFGTASLSQKVSNDFAAAKSNWNKNVGGLVTLNSFAVSGIIKSAAAKEAVINQIMADDAMAGYGNILDESSMHLNTIGELQAENAETKNTMRTYLNKQVDIGDLIVDVSWQNPTKSFISKAIVHDDAIVWDNLLTSSISVNPTPNEISSIPTDASTSNAAGSVTNAKVYSAWYSVSYTWQGDWIWGSKRGEMGCTITIYCNTKTGHVNSTDHSDFANMQLGSAKSESKVLVNTGSYGKIQYALGIATPFASVSFNSSNFKVSVSGLGSSMVENGSKTLYPW